MIPHRNAGVNCNGTIVPEQESEQVTLKCNACGSLVGSGNAKILAALEQAIADNIVIHKFNDMDAPEVLTSISDECQRGECGRCPGTFRRSEAGDQIVFCVHSCHEVSEGSSGGTVN